MKVEELNSEKEKIIKALEMKIKEIKHKYNPKSLIKNYISRLFKKFIGMSYEMEQ